MQQFTVPQFIDVENKIIGPLTTRQFIIMLAGFIIAGISYKIFDFSLFITVTVFTLIICGIFAFVKISGRPFHFFVLNLTQTFKRARTRVWNNCLGRIDYGREKDAPLPLIETIAPPIKRYTDSRLAELSLVVDTGGAYVGEQAEVETEIKIV